MGTTAITALIVIGVASIAIYADAGRGARLVFAGVAAMWAGLAAAAANAGWFAAPDYSVIGIFVAAPLVAAALACASPRVRNAALALPLSLLIALNTGRLVAFLFLGLENAGRLAGPFPFYAGWGDIVAAILAVPLAIVAAGAWRDSHLAVASIFAWNLFGIADLLGAIFLGVTSAEGSPLQLFHTPPGSEAMQHAPFALVPTVLVPFYLIMHVIVWVKVAGALRMPAPARE